MESDDPAAGVPSADPSTGVLAGTTGAGALAVSGVADGGLVLPGDVEAVR